MHRLTWHSRNLGLIAGLLLCAGMATTPAMAASVPITFSFTGYVTKVGDKLTDGPFYKHQSVTGSYTFNPGTPDTNPSHHIGEYKGALDGPSTNLNVTFHDGATTTYVASLRSGSNEIEVKNPYNFSDESYEVEGKFSGAKVNWNKPNSFELELEHPSSNQFNNDSLPLTPPTVSAFAERTLRLTFGYEGHDKTVTIKLKDMSVVPLPPAVILFGAGLVALIGLGARNRRKQGSSVA